MVLKPINLPHDWGMEDPYSNTVENNTGLLPCKGIELQKKPLLIGTYVISMPHTWFL
jgi:hypothetical protein